MWEVCSRSQVRQFGKATVTAWEGLKVGWARVSRIHQGQANSFARLMETQTCLLYTSDAADEERLV